MSRALASLGQRVLGWFDAYRQSPPADSDHIDWVRTLPFLAIHAGVLLLPWCGFSWTAFWTAVGLYVVRMFGITAFYHRCFSHRAFEVGRPVRLVGAILGNAAAQRGPLWWASHHRHHHGCADQPEDAHSPVQRGFWWSHLLWFLADRNYRTATERVKDLARFPELLFLDRYDALVPLVLAGCLTAVGGVLAQVAPELGTGPLQMLVWGFCISTVAVYHGTFTINSLSHLIGRQRFDTGNSSRNNWLLAIITLGEGWHNNHHHYGISARQGFYWWEYDFSYYALVVMSWLHLVSDLKPVPPQALTRNRLDGVAPPRND